MAFDDTRNDVPNEPTPGSGSVSAEQPQAQSTPDLNPNAKASERPTTPANATTAFAGGPAPIAGPTRNEKETMTEDFATALETFEQEQSELAANEDRVLKGTVISINPNHLVVDIGLKSEGVVPLAEVQDHEGNVKFQPGEELDVMIEKGHTEEGYINLSHQKAQRLHAWDEIEKAYNEKASIKVRVIDRIKGGLTVDVMGARAFLPGSQVDTRPDSQPGLARRGRKSKSASSR